MEKNNIVVIVRETFPTDQLLTPEAVKSKKVLNPYDEYSIFQSVKIKEKYPANLICVFITERKDQYGLRTALGLGADSGIFVSFNSKDEKEQAEVLANILKDIDFKMIFMGIKDVNDDSEELPYRLAHLLNLPIYPHIKTIDVKDKTFYADKETEKTIDSIMFSKTGIVAFSRNIYEPQYPSIANILSIKDKKIIEYSISIEEEDRNIVYNDVSRKQRIFKRITPEEGAEKIVNYMKKWQINS